MLSASTAPSSARSAASEDLSSTSSALTSNPSPPSPPSSSETHTCPYKDCHKSFSKKYNLKAHLRLHTGEQPFECDRPDCRKKFKWRSSLSSHSVWHTRKDNGTASPSSTLSKNNTVSKPSAPTSSNPNTTTRMPAVRQTSSPRASSKISASSHTSSAKHPKKAPALDTVPVTVTSKSTSNSVTSSQSQKRKRPRAECPRSDASSTTPPPHLPTSRSSVDLQAHSPNITDFDVIPDRMPSPSRFRSKSTRSPTKKRKANTAKRSVTSPKKQTVESPPALEDALVLSPGSPVTSDGDASDHLMDLDVFSCDMLPPLIPRDGDGLALDADDVGAIIGESDAELFGYGSSCGALPGLDTRFGPFDMDNLQGFCSSRVEGL